ncbi:MAG: hypothetical protein ACI9UT_001406 [Flavobacteriales bacterium]|jgi:hypothetical protein
MNNLYSFVLLSTLLTACGGGGGGTTANPTAGTSDSQPSNPLTASVQSQPAVTEFSLEENKPMEAGVIIESAAQTSHDIIVPSGFALNSERSFNLKITRSKDDYQSAYLSICSDYQQHNDDSYSINYDSCLLRTSLSDINYEAVITVTNDTKGLVAALWFMDIAKKPLINDWRF